MLIDAGCDTGPLLDDLAKAGMTLAWTLCDCSNLVREVQACAPDVVIAHLASPGATFFEACRALGEALPLPVVVFTGDPDEALIEPALAAGVHSYVVQGYAGPQLKPVVAVARARFEREQALLAQLQDVSQRFEERKLVERAKGILMRARAMSDDDAFDVLRTASMHTNQRLAAVSRHIIESAQRAEAVNRAGQLRMVSQRLVKLHLLRLADVHAVKHLGLLEESIDKVEGNLQWLEKSLRDTPHADVLGLLKATWKALLPVLRSSRQTTASLQRLDDLAQRLLDDAEALTSLLQQEGAVPSLQVLNVAGRQRMLSQRFAKIGLMNMLLGDESSRELRDQELDRVRGDFERALSYLKGLPLSTPEIKAALVAASSEWTHLLTAVARPVGTGKERLQRTEVIAQASESLLAGFESLSTEYERSMQMLTG